ncbi:MAG: hypothetical protein ABR987_07785 [Terracidiphilus sp.]
MKNVKIAGILFGLTGAILFAETVVGCIAMLGVGFFSFQDVLLGLCLTMAFPIFLLMLVSSRITTFFLWIFFFAQWIGMCLISRPPTLINPLDGIHGDALLLGVVLFTIADILIHRGAPEISAVGPENITATQDPPL